MSLNFFFPGKRTITIKQLGTLLILKEVFVLIYPHLTSIRFRDFHLKLQAFFNGYLDFSNVYYIITTLFFFYVSHNIYKLKRKDWGCKDETAVNTLLLSALMMGVVVAFPETLLKSNFNDRSPFSLAVGLASCYIVAFSEEFLYTGLLLTQSFLLLKKRLSPKLSAFVSITIVSFIFAMNHIPGAINSSDILLSFIIRFLTQFTTSLIFFRTNNIFLVTLLHFLSNILDLTNVFYRILELIFYLLLAMFYPKTGKLFASVPRLNLNLKKTIIGLVMLCALILYVTSYYISAEDHLKAGALFHLTEQYEKAMSSYNKAIAEDSLMLLAYTQKAYIYDTVYQEPKKAEAWRKKYEYYKKVNPADVCKETITE